MRPLPIKRVLLRSLPFVIMAYTAFAGLVWRFAERLILPPPGEARPSLR